MAPPTMLLQAVTAFLFLSAISASPFIKLAPAPPSMDDFYSLPKGYEKASPGDILRHRKPPGPLAAFGDIPLNLHSSYQIEFRTTNNQGKPDTAVTTILIPKSANNSRLISYQDFEDSSSVNCATSYALHQRKKFNTGLSKSDVLFEAGLLNQGYYVNLPDYEGHKAAFGSGPQAGYATLDSIRAVLKSSKFTGIAERDVDITMWGYSGGSIPTEWAAEMQPDYAPELKILGAAVGVIIGTSMTPSTSLSTTHHTLDSVSQVSSACTKPSKAKKKFSKKDILSYFRSGAGFLNKPLVKDIVERAGIMGKHGVPQIPMYFYQAVQDEVLPIKSNDELIDGHCNKNINSLQYVRHKVGNHAATSFAGDGGANAFLKDRYNGVFALKGCHKSDVLLADLDQKNLEGFGDTIVGLLGSLTTAPLGGDLGNAVDGAEDKVKDKITGLFGADDDEKKDTEGEKKDDDLGSKVKDITRGWW
ncbi:hypothetical protein IFR05_002102 [Cadophora sp. M221]|nr:hypothetical protein IFR05_002102 [Cadophora sp. M221]